MNVMCPVRACLESEIYVQHLFGSHPCAVKLHLHLEIGGRGAISEPGYTSVPTENIVHAITGYIESGVRIRPKHRSSKPSAVTSGSVQPGEVEGVKHHRIGH